MSIIQRVRPAIMKALTQRISANAIAARAVPARAFSGDGGHGISYPEGEDLSLTGRQYEVALLGNFPDTPAIQPFGTMKHPALIYSGHASRIVGCIGGGPYTHRLQWFNLKEGKKHVCSHCGQVFKLVTDRNYPEVKDIVDARTREHFDYYNTLAVNAGQAPPAAKLQVGPHSKF